MSNKPAKIEDFVLCVTELEKRLKNNSAFSNFIKFSSGDLTVNTSSLHGNYLLSMNSSKNGSGCANAFTIVLAYSPMQQVGLSVAPSTPNYIDEKLKINTKRYKVMSGSLQYGYDDGSNKLLTSPYYNITLLNYSHEIRDNLLYYTFKGYSSVTQYANWKVDIEEQKNTNPIKFIRDTFPEITADAGDDKAEDTIVIGDCFNIEVTDEAVSKAENLDIEAFSQRPIFEILDTLVSLATDKTEDSKDAKGETNEEELQSKTWYYYISDGETDDETGKPKPKIIVDVFDPAKAKSAVAFTFNWMDLSNSIVVDFKTEFDGIIYLARDAMRDVDPTHAYVDEEGEAHGDTTGSDGLKYWSGSGTAGGPPLNKDDQYAPDEDKIIDDNEWLERMQYSYKAQLTLIGIPKEAPIGMYIKINPMIYGQLHSTAGTYMVTKAEDNISSSGFLTTLDLIKVPDKQ